MANWSEFYYLVGSAAAGLTGLMFIAVTFGSRLITKDKLPYVEAFFSPMAYHFIHAFMLCAVALMPVTGPKELGAAIVLSTAWRFALLGRTYRMTRLASRESSDIELSDWILGLYLPAVVYLAMITAGFCFWNGLKGAATIFAVSLLCLLLVALQRAWEMLLWTATKLE